MSLSNIPDIISSIELPCVLWTGLGQSVLFGSSLVPATHVLQMHWEWKLSLHIHNPFPTLTLLHCWTRQRNFLFAFTSQKRRKTFLDQAGTLIHPINGLSHPCFCHGFPLYTPFLNSKMMHVSTLAWIKATGKTARRAFYTGTKLPGNYSECLHYLFVFSPPGLAVK